MTYGAEYWGPPLIAAAGTYFSNQQNASNNRKAQKYAYEKSLDLAENMPSRQIKGMRDAGINPLLAMGGAPVMQASPPAPVNYTADMGQMMQAFNQVGVGSSQQNLMDQQANTERMRTVVNENEAIKGNYEIQALAGTVDAAMRVTGESSSADAVAALEMPRIRAGLAELRAALASANNAADVEEAINSKGVSMALDVLGKVTGSGGSIAAAVDRFRARSQRGAIIDLNKE